jgi:hypothetical protein
VIGTRPNSKFSQLGNYWSPNWSAVVPPRDDFLHARVGRCSHCEAPLATDQRWCVDCGTRRGPVSDGMRKLMAGMAAATPVPGIAEAEPAHEFSLPAPRAAAVAIAALLAFGVLLGSLVSPAENSAAESPIVVALSPPPAAPAPAPAPAPAAAATDDTSAVDNTAVAAPVTPPTQTIYQQAPQAPAAPAPPKPLPVPPLPPLPSVSHIFVVMLTGHGEDAAFGANSQATYLSKTLVKDGELIPNYYAIAHGGLDNEVAMVSGQGPNPDTANNCPNYTDVSPGTVGDQDQASGNGCVYPPDTKTIADQLFLQGSNWKAYIEDYSKGADGCKPGDAYEAWRNPFIYFHSLVDSPACGSNMADLAQLSTDMQQVGDTPTLSYLIPNRCHDGSDTLCTDGQPDPNGQPAGLAGADQWLQTVIPAIEKSPGYTQGGLIAITFDSAPKDGPEADSSSCCGQPDTYPNLPADDSSQQPSQAQPGQPSTDQSGQASTDQSGQPTTDQQPAPADPNATPSASAASVHRAHRVHKADDTTTGTTPAPTTPPPVKPTGGGGKVGLLLISPYIKPNTVNTTGYYNHFSFFASIEDLFTIGHIAYANLPDLTVFDKTVYTAYNGGG